MLSVICFNLGQSKSLFSSNGSWRMHRFWKQNTYSKPSDLQVTSASGFEKKSSHTVPTSPLIVTWTRPDRQESPPISLISSDEIKKSKFGYIVKNLLGGLLSLNILALSKFYIPHNPKFHEQKDEKF